MKKGLAIMAFGTSHHDAYKNNISPIYHEAIDTFTDVVVRKGITSRIVKRILEKEYEEFVPNEKEIVELLKEDGCQKIYIQPLHLLKGHEYEKLLMEGVILGSPLFETEEDVKRFAERMDFHREKEDCLVLMGHGSSHEAEWIYEALEKTYRDKGYDQFFIGTVEGSITLDHILPKLKERAIKKVYLQPLMLVAGDHAKNDMAGEEEDSWKSRLEAAGIEVEVVLKGVGEYEEVRQLYMKKMKELLERSQ